METKRKAILVDLDGTLVASEHRPVEMYRKSDGKIDYDAWNNDCPGDGIHWWCAELVTAMSKAGYMIVFLTARGSNQHNRMLTENWLRTHLSWEVEWVLHMGPYTTDKTDYDNKRDQYFNEIAPLYDILFAVDDKSSVIKIWRDIGLPALHCKDY